MFSAGGHQLLSLILGNPNVASSFVADDEKMYLVQPVARLCARLVVSDAVQTTVSTILGSPVPYVPPVPAGDADEAAITV